MRTTNDLRATPELKGVRSLNIDDVKAILVLTEACREADDIETIPNEEQMRRQFETPDIEITNNAFILENDTGEIIATVAAVPLPGVEEYHIQIQGMVRPDYRSNGHKLEDLLMEYGLANASEWIARTGKKATIQAGCRSDRQHYIDLFTRHGFAPVRYFHTLERDLNAPIVPSTIPDDLRVRSINIDSDGKFLHMALHEAFQDHFNPMNFTLEQTMHWIASPETKPELILLALAVQDGVETEPAAICMNHIRTNYNLQHNKLEGEISALGVRREFRRRGLARFMLTKSLSLLKEAGMTSATLSVDSENPLGATELYASVGFTQRKTAIVFQWSPSSIPQ